MNSIKFIGTKGLVDEESEFHKFHSSLVVRSNGEELLIDWGAVNPNGLRGIDPEYIINTHAHPDHVEGLFGKDVKVYISQTTKLALPKSERTQSLKGN